jgi:hypothetical protein
VRASPSAGAGTCAEIDTIVLPATSTFVGPDSAFERPSKTRTLLNDVLDGASPAVLILPLRRR